jgi:hypothetical protein
MARSTKASETPDEEGLEEETSAQPEGTDDPNEGAPAPEPADASAEGFDPMLVDPSGTAAARVEGTTSDSAVRAEGTPASEVPVDTGVGPQSTDAGTAPPGGDVEIATVEAGSGEGESWPPVTVEDQVILKEDPTVPPRLVGRRAFVIDAPRDPIPVGSEVDTWLTVKTRDEVNAMVTVPLTAVELIRGGKNAAVRG